MRPVLVEVRDVGSEDVGEVAAPEDQDPVEVFPADATDPALGVRPRLGRSHRRLDHPDPFGAEDLVELAGELTGVSGSAQRWRNSTPGAPAASPVARRQRCQTAHRRVRVPPRGIEESLLVAVEVEWRPACVGPQSVVVKASGSSDPGARPRIDSLWSSCGPADTPRKRHRAVVSGFDCGGLGRAKALVDAGLLALDQRWRLDAPGRNRTSARGLGSRSHQCSAVRLSPWSPAGPGFEARVVRGSASAYRCVRLLPVDGR